MLGLLSADPTAPLSWGDAAWRLLATAFFVFVNGFFVAAEFALVKVRTIRIEELAKAGRRTAIVASHMTRHLDRYLSACQLGITLASLILGALGEPAVSRVLIRLGQAAGIANIDTAKWVSPVAIAIAFTIITFLHMTIGEQAPKMWALRKAEPTVLVVSMPLRAFTFVLSPFIALINHSSNFMLRLVGLPPMTGHGEGPLDADEIRSIMTLSATAGNITPQQLEITENVFRMMELEVRHILVARVDVVYLSLSDPLEESLKTLRESGHSRFPLCRDDLDSIVGFIHRKDVTNALLEDRSVDLEELSREPLIVPDTMALSTFLQEVMKTGDQCAGVIDEHGTVIGLAFREDALEEIVGELGDEFDTEDPDFEQLDDFTHLVDASVSLPEARDRLDLNIDDDEGEETIGGYIVARLGRLPQKGDVVKIGEFKVTVIALRHQQARRLRFERVPTEPVDGAAHQDAEH